MRKFIVLVAVSLVTNVSILATSEANAGDSLFSQVPIESVFATPGSTSSSATSPATSTPANSNSVEKVKPQTPPSSVPAAPIEKKIGITQIEELLRQAGFETKELISGVISTKIKTENWSFPVIMKASDDQKRLAIVLMLKTVKDEKQIPVEKVLALMTANRQHAPAYFSVSTKSKRVELHNTIQNEELTSEALKEELERLAGIAQTTHEIWNFPVASTSSSATTSAPNSAANSSTTPAPPKPNPPTAGSTAPNAKPTGTSATTPTAKPVGKTLSVVGKWSATPAEKQAFALQLDADSKFTMVQINQGKQIRLTGKYTLGNHQLNFVADDGTKLSGTITNQSENEFQIKLESSTDKPVSMTFRRAK